MDRITSYLTTILDALFFEGTATKRGNNSLKVSVFSFVFTAVVVFIATLFSNSIVWSRFAGFLGVNLFFGIIFYVGYKTNCFENDPLKLAKNLLSIRKKPTHNK